MAAADAGSWLLCGRTVGYAVAGTFFTLPDGRPPDRLGRHLRCGDCKGTIIFEPDAGAVL
jgi:hypothetical protein